MLNLNEVGQPSPAAAERTLGEHIELITCLDRDLEPVLADPGQIEQVLVNLAVNARDAMPAGGRLTIEPATLDLDESYAASAPEPRPGPYVALKVSDTGTGMPQEVIDRAFEPFFTTKPKGEGTGLGLATVYGIVTQAGGNVRIYSEPGLGTTLDVLLPVTEHDGTEEELPIAEPSRGTGQTVLLVEDEDALREVTRRLLCRNGYQVLAAADGQAALDLAARRPDGVELLLTDVIMPNMQGREVAEQIGALQPRARVLFMSGYTQGLLGEQGVLEPGVQLIEKPFTERGLLIKLNQIFSAPAP